jgi:gliding motility-associated-like protein
VLFFLLLLGFSSFAQWTAKNPFTPKVFIQNNGQYDLHDEGLKDEILFSANQDGLQYYFTKNAIWIKHASIQKRTEHEIEKLQEKLGIKEEEKKGKEEKEFAIKIVNQFHIIEFISGGNSTTIQSESLVSQIYNFGTQTNQTISAKAFKKIIYKNLYPGVDMEFYFPEDKQGFKYNFILNPGADVHQIQMRFPEAEKIKIDEQNNLVVTSIFGDFIDHAPIAKDLSGKNINCSFKLKKNIVAFNIANFTNSNGFIIDPWTTTPSFTGSTNAYDVDWDNFGNCYVYGGPMTSYQVIKFNAAGTPLWSFTPAIACLFYGDFVVDKRTGSVYIIEAYNNSSAVKVIKTNTNGVQVGMYAVAIAIDEMWRVAINPCLNILVIAGGGDQNPYYTACTLDTNLANFTGANILGVMNPWHDMWGLAIDNVGNAYTIAALSFSGTAQCNNYLFKSPLPALTPNSFSVTTNYQFLEARSEIYNPVTYGGGGAYANGYNGMMVSNTSLYTWDSNVLKKWNTSTGALTNSSTINGASQVQIFSGGITADNCDHLFLGDQNTIKQYDGVTTTLVNTISAPNTVYDVNLNNNNILYACGNGFVSAFQVNLPICTTATTNLLATNQVNNPSCTSTNGTATVSITGGVAPYSVTWNTNPVQTGTVITNLTGGTYVATIRDNSCPPLISLDTITITPTATSFSLNTTSQAVKCFGVNSGTAIVNITGGTGPFGILWSNGQTGLTDTDLVAGTYTVQITDLSSGCIASAIAPITQPQQITVTVPNGTVCIGQTHALNATVSGGTTPYTFNWNNGISAANPFNISPVSTSSYTIAVIDFNGCKTADSLITISVTPPLNVIIGDTGICVGNIVTITAHATGGNGAYIYNWMPGNLNSNNISVSPVSTTIYTITVNDGCTVNPAIDTGMVNVVPAPIITMPNSVAGCAQLCVHFTNPPGLANWQWNFGDNLTSSFKNPIHCYAVSGSFYPSITYTSTTGCISQTTSSNTITVFGLSHTQFIATPNPTDILNPEVYFYNQFTNSSNWQWLFGDGTSSTLQNPSHIYAQMGTYTVTLIAQNQQGCSDTITEQITITDIFTFYAPNTFTPDGDMLNEKFLPIGEGWNNATYYLWIYDRWGNLIFKTQDPFKGWDGKINANGDIVQEDVYVWKAQLSDIFKKQHQYSGTITLIK